MRAAGTPAATSAAMIAPVDVPATKEKMSRVSLRVVSSSLAQGHRRNGAANAAAVNRQEILARHGPAAV